MWPDENGWLSDFAPIVDTSYDQPRTDATVVQDIVTQRQDVNTSGNDAWTGFFQKGLGAVLEYGLRRDATQVGMELQAQRQKMAMPLYGPAAGLQPTIGAGGITVSPVLLLIVGLVAVVVLK